jgi:hypothetical protein
MMLDFKGMQNWKTGEPEFEINIPLPEVPVMRTPAQKSGKAKDLKPLM